MSTQTPQRKSTLLPFQPSPMAFQIDTAATCNSLSEYVLLRLMPNMKLRKSPYLLHSYGDAQPLGQIDLLWELNKRYESLTFQILPRDVIVMMNKPAPCLWVQLCGCTGTHHHQQFFPHISSKKTLQERESPTYQASSSHTTSPDPGSPTAKTNSTPKDVKS